MTAQDKVAKPAITSVSELPRAEFTREEALSGANPHYSTGKPEWRNNCTRCAMTHEARIRGYDVTAAPRPKGDYSNQVAHKAYGTDLLWETPGKLASVGKGDPDGARYFVRFTWKGYGGGGHIVTAERRAGKTVFTDPQNGGYDILHSELQGKVKDIRFIRVDQHEIRDGAMQFFEGYDGK